MQRMMVDKMKFSLSIDSYKPLRDIVFEALREAILSGSLAPGERLMEIQLAEDMGVSRTPVREAIRKLELEGFVVMIPRKGTYVAGLSMKQMSEVFEVRAALEELAVDLSAERISDEELEQLEHLLISISDEMVKDDIETIVKLDEEFHDLLYKTARNSRLSSAINHLTEQMHRYRTASLSYPGRLKSALEEHRNIVEAIARRDGDAARKAAREHMDTAESSYIQAMMDINKQYND